MPGLWGIHYRWSNVGSSPTPGASISFFMSGQLVIKRWLKHNTDKVEIQVRILYCPQAVGEVIITPNRNTQGPLNNA